MMRVVFLLHYHEGVKKEGVSYDQTKIPYESQSANGGNFCLPGRRSTAIRNSVIPSFISEYRFSNIHSNRIDRRNIDPGHVSHSYVDPHRGSRPRNADNPPLRNPGAIRNCDNPKYIFPHCFGEIGAIIAKRRPLCGHLR